MILVTVNQLNSSIKNYDWLNKNDLFVIIKYGTQIRRTTTKWNDDHPEWNESFLFTKNDDDTIEVSLYDEDSWSKDETIKSDSIKLSDPINTVCEVNISISQVKCIDIKTAKNYMTLKDINNDLKHKCKYLKDQLKKYNDNINKIKEIVEELD